MAESLKKITVFFQESKLELKKTNWPSKEETIKYTIFVIIISLGLAIFLGFLDAVFLKVLELLIS